MMKARRAMTTADKPQPAAQANTGLVGRGFHLLDLNDCAKWQGRVIADLGEGYFLLELADWIMGEGNQQVVLHLSELGLSREDGYATRGRFVFYDSMEDMNDYFQRVLRHRSERRKGKEAPVPADTL